MFLIFPSLLLCGIRAAETIAIYQVSLKSTFKTRDIPVERHEEAWAYI